MTTAGSAIGGAGFRIFATPRVATALGFSSSCFSGLACCSFARSDPSAFALPWPCPRPCFAVIGTDHARTHTTEMTANPCFLMHPSLNAPTWSVPRRAWTEPDELVPHLQSAATIAPPLSEEDEKGTDVPKLTRL